MLKNNPKDPPYPLHAFLWSGCIDKKNVFAYSIFIRNQATINTINSALTLPLNEDWQETELGGAQRL